MKNATVQQQTVPGMMYFENIEFNKRLPPTDPQISAASSFVVSIFKVSFKPVVVSFCFKMLVDASSPSRFLTCFSRLLIISAVVGFPLRKVEQRYLTVNNNLPKISLCLNSPSFLFLSSGERSSKTT